MPRITNPELRKGKIARNAAICAMFEEIINKDYTVDKAIRDIMQKYGLGESAIMKIVKGTYPMKEPEPTAEPQYKQLSLFDTDNPS